jgi:transcriptional regulator with XRE-family HTH domain
VTAEETIGKMILMAREVLDLTQTQVATMAGVDQTTVSRWEREESLPGVEHLKPLADGLGLSYVRLLEALAKQAGRHAEVRIKKVDRFERLLNRQSAELDRLHQAVDRLVDAVLRGQQGDEASPRGETRR